MSNVYVSLHGRFEGFPVGLLIIISFVTFSLICYINILHLTSTENAPFLFLDFSVILQCHTLIAPYCMFTVHMHKQSVTHKGCHFTGTFLVNKRTDDIIILRNNEF